METSNNWKYLVRKPKSSYKHLFVKDRWVSARTLYGQFVCEDPRTAEQLAADFDLPLEAVLEAIAYCQSDPPEIREDWEREQRLLEAKGVADPSQRLATPRVLSSQERVRLRRQ